MHRKKMTTFKAWLLDQSFMEATARIIDNRQLSESLNYDIFLSWLRINIVFVDVNMVTLRHEFKIYKIFKLETFAAVVQWQLKHL